MEVKILLSTYNGERFLKEFLESLCNQTYKDWALVVRDDGSRDSTLKIVEEFASSYLYRGKVSLLRDEGGTLGPCRSFLTLLQRAKGDYFFFADQDDVWLPNKIEKLLSRMIELEERYGRKIPMILHSDAVVVDQNLREIATSLWLYERLDPNRKTLNYLLVQNNITGCCMVVNRALKTLLKEIPHRAVMHDWWLGLVASALGLIEYYPERLVLYRQHSGQNTGAKGYRVSVLLRRAFDWKGLIHSLERSLWQAREFLRIYGPYLSNEQHKLLHTFINLPRESFYSKLALVSKYRFYKSGLLKNLGFMVVLLLLKEVADGSECLHCSV